MSHFKRFVAVIILVNILLFSAACAKEVPPPAPTPQFLEHTIKYPGETLAVIAQWYTGSAKNWTILAEQNPQIKPNRMKMGDVIKIPEAMLEKVEPLPKKLLKGTSSSDNVDAAEKKVAKEAPAKQPEQKKNEEAKKEAPKENTANSPAVVEPQSPVAAAPVTSEPLPEQQPAAASVEAPVEMEESLVLEPTPFAAEPLAIPPTLSPDEKAKEDLIDELLKN